MAFRAADRKRGIARSARVRSRLRIARAKALAPAFSAIMKGGVVQYVDIARALNSSGIRPPRASLWTSQAVGKMLRAMKSLGIDPGPEIGPYGTRYYGRPGTTPTHPKKWQRFEWTPARKSALRNLTRHGFLSVTMHVAHKKLGCTVNQLREGLRQINARAKPRTIWTADKLEQLRSLTGPGGKLRITQTAAAKRFKCDKGTLRLGMVLMSHPPYQRFRWTPRRIARLRALADDGVLRVSTQAAIQRLGCSAKVLRRAMRSLQLHPKPAFSWAADCQAKLESLTDAVGKLTVTHDKAAAILGCSPRSIDKMMSARRKRRALKHTP